MKVITKYQAIDGKEFVWESECLDYENLISSVEKIMSELPPLPKNDGCNFENGGGYIQHDKQAAIRVRRALLELAAKYSSLRWIQDSIENENADPSWAARAIAETGIRPLENAWHRFLCMTTDFREFGQPYFRTHPEKAQQFNIYDSVRA